ncbi:MAG: nitroreductase/quinone reductase family protein [Alphaproteobacteria bacterium]|jgi:deazaflavin-dependent oxidoreductase (nitroreductase family)|nr:nitroreductase/quinone reductase family protein [Alphaproteobacteria bacterium]MDP6814277.1 nitroreductase/quinone reductase family protein [Alphaproteobacteria bacterium]
MIEVPQGLPQWITDHIKLYLEDPEKAHMWDASLGSGGTTGLLTTLLLISKGRKSGQDRPLPLIYRKIGDDYVIIASKGGAPAHPSWFLNLEAEPNCVIHVGPEKYRAKARVAEGDERAAKWQAMAEIYAPYDDYQVRAGERQIPVVVLEVQAALSD